MVALLAFPTGPEMLEVLQINCWSTLFPRFGITLIKKLLKIFSNLSSFQISWLFRCRFMNTFDLTLFEKSGFTLAQCFLLSQRFLISRFSMHSFRFTNDSHTFIYLLVIIQSSLCSFFSKQSFALCISALLNSL